jgi:hypothetical protein
MLLSSVISRVGSALAGGFAAANLARTRTRGRRARLVTDAALDDLGARNWRGHLVAKAATNAVANRWQDGPDTPDGVRARLRPGEDADADYRQRVAGLLGRLDDGPSRWPSAAPGSSARPGRACPRAGCYGWSGRCRGPHSAPDLRAVHS